MSFAAEYHKGSGRLRDQRGSQVVEFAIAATVLLVLLFGIIEYGYVLSFKQSLTQAAAEGARQAAVNGPAAALPQVAKAVGAFNQTCGVGGLDCTASDTPADTGCTTTGECLRVRVSYNWKDYPILPKFPGLGLLLPDTLTSTSITRLG